MVHLLPRLLIGILRFSFIIFRAAKQVLILLKIFFSSRMTDDMMYKICNLNTAFGIYKIKAAVNQEISEVDSFYLL
uniref:Putative ovule protein n=1 Tax=Solanum chacoense TaxID=4108 RepID=A0A0V0HCI3_SOLCH